MTSSIELPAAPTPSMAWDAWGNASERAPLSESTRSMLEAALGIATTHGPTRRVVGGPRLRRSRLAERRRRALEAIVGAEHVSTDDAVRAFFLGGKSTFDLLARRSGAVQNAPDAIVFPGTAEEIEAVLRYCSEEAVAVVPFGGGTSVVGGVDPVREWFDTVLTISTRRLCTMTNVDEFSRTATLQAGVTGPQAEEMLGRHGLTLGHYPQSFVYASIGGFAATRSSGQASAGYGRFDDMVESMSVVTPVGITHTGRAPASAAGPDLRQVFLGSEGTLGVITSVTLRVHPVPESTEYRSWWFPDFATGVGALRVLAAHSGRPTVMRLSDEAETAVDTALSSEHAADTPTGGCIAIATFDGSHADAMVRATDADAVVRLAGGEVLDADRARRWEHTRFDSPYLRDTLLDVGAVAETLETATSWSDLSRVRDAVTAALIDTLTSEGTPPIVMCHVSHVYATGASLYFTVVFAAADDPSTRLRVAKDAAVTASTGTGATVTHHHGVGRDHRQWMPEEIGHVGTTLLRAIKSAVDPAGVLNPGKLIP